MRTVTPPLQAKLDQKLGTEPILLVEIEWVDGSPIMYSDQKIDGADYPYPIILEMGGFDTSMMLSGASDSLTISMTLDDIDGHLKEIYLNNDVHKRPAKVYLTYKGLNLADKTLLFKGEIVTPFEWDEGKRSLSFTVLSKLAETEAGFSMEEGDFPNIPEEAWERRGRSCLVRFAMCRPSRYERHAEVICWLVKASMTSLCTPGSARPPRSNVPPLTQATSLSTLKVRTTTGPTRYSRRLVLLWNV